MLSSIYKFFNSSEIIFTVTNFKMHSFEMLNAKFLKCYEDKTAKIHKDFTTFFCPIK